MTHATKKNWRQSYAKFMPPGAGSLFIIQMFSTLGFSVLYSTLVLYATQGLRLSDTYAMSITGSFVALNYFLHLLGGYLGGRYLSYRSLFSFAMILQLFGCILIATPTMNYLLWGLAFFLTGSGMNVTCINCMVTQLFEPNDNRRETAFLWNYSGMNIGFFIGFMLGGYFHLQHNYHQLFLISGLGNLIALLIIISKWKLLTDRKTIFIETAQNLKKKSRIIGLATVISLLFSLRLVLEQTEFCNLLILIIGALMGVVIIILALKQPTPESRSKMAAFFILSLASVLFWTLYQLAPMGLNLFIDRNVDRHLFGILIAPQWIQNINTVVIIVGGPLLGVVFAHLREAHKINITVPLQFSIALFLIGVAMLLLPIGIHFANSQGYISFGWILATFVLLSIGELFISPIGYAMVGQLAPVHLRGVMMGTWMMITGVAAILSNYFSKLAVGPNESINPLITNASYSHTFGILGMSSVVAGALLVILIPMLVRLTQENKMAEFKDELLQEMKV